MSGSFLLGKAFPSLQLIDKPDLARRLLVHALGSGVPGCHVQALGKTSDEVQQFLQAAIGTHILIMDQHLDYGPGLPPVFLYLAA